MKRLKNAGHRDGRGCTCERCESRRTYMRERYAAKYKGIPRNRATGKEMNNIRNNEAKNQEPRLVESVGPEGTVYHWMPKEGEEWACPRCPASFLKLDTGEWVPEGYGSDASSA